MATTLTPEELQAQKYGDYRQGLINKAKGIAPVVPVVNTTQALIDEAKNKYGEQAYNQSVSGKTVNIAPVQPVTPTATPVNPNAPVPGSASSILGNQINEADQYASQLAQENLANYNQSVDPQAIYQEKLKQSQAQIDALNAVYQDQINQARLQGQGRLGSQTAMQARGGLLGSDFGQAQVRGLEQANQNDINEINRQKSLELQAIYSGVRKSADEEAAAKAKAKAEGGAAYLQYLQGKQERKNQLVKDSASKLLSLGIDPNTISDSELKGLGIDRNDLNYAYQQAESAFAATSNKAALENAKTQAEIQKTQAEAIKAGVESGKYYEVGNKIYESGTNKFISDATFNPNSMFMNVPAGSTTINTKTGQPINLGQGGASGDLRSYSTQYPREAWASTNNPAGLTVSPTFTQTLQNAGIQVESIKSRPANEGGSYYVFPTIEEGIKAYQLLWNSPSYQNLTVGQALQRWGTGNLNVPVDKNKKVSDLSNDELLALQSAQIAKESPGLSKILSSGGISPTQEADYNTVVSTINDLLAKKDLAGSIRVRNPSLNLGANENTNFIANSQKLGNILLSMDGPQIKKLFGPQISDSDIKAIQSILKGGLDVANQTPDQFQKTLLQLYDKLKIKNPNIGAINSQTVSQPYGNSTPSGLTYTIN